MVTIGRSITLIVCDVVEEHPASVTVNETVLVPDVVQDKLVGP